MIRKLDSRLIKVPRRRSYDFGLSQIRHIVPGSLRSPPTTSCAVVCYAFSMFSVDLFLCVRMLVSQYSSRDLLDHVP